MSGKRGATTGKLTARRVRRRLKLVSIGESGDRERTPRFVRLISRGSWNASDAAWILVAAESWCKEFKADLLITHGQFGKAEGRPSSSDRENSCWQQLQQYLANLLAMLPSRRSADIVFGLDSAESELQTACFIPKETKSLSRVAIAWKCYPREDEKTLVLTKGKRCPASTIRRGAFSISMLVCHDAVVFAGRSKSNRGEVRQSWAEVVEKELNVRKKRIVVHLVHYLDSSRQGQVFVNAMKNLSDKGFISTISGFGTNAIPDERNSPLAVLRWKTAKFAGPTLDLFVNL